MKKLLWTFKVKTNHKLKWKSFRLAFIPSDWGRIQSNNQLRLKLPLKDLDIFRYDKVIHSMVYWLKKSDARKYCLLVRLGWVGLDRIGVWREQLDTNLLCLPIKKAHSKSANTKFIMKILAKSRCKNSSLENQNGFIFSFRDLF